jgi:phage tail-like protein
MARAKISDFLHSFRFHVVITGFGAGIEKQLLRSGPDRASAGFNAVSTPEASHDAVEYREGTFIYTQKFPGIPSISDVTLSRGVAHKDGTFWTWMKDVIEGNAEYRANLSIFHLHRDSRPASSTPASTEFSPPEAAPPGGFIHYKCEQALPIRHKVSSDLDATASEVSIQELDLAIESFDVVDEPFGA